MPVEMTAQQFLDIFYGDGPFPDYRFHICTIDDQTMHVEWFSNAEEAGAYAQGQQYTNVHFTTGMFSKEMAERSPYRKGKQKEVVGISGLSVDIDFKDSVKARKQKLPESAEEAVEIFEKFPWSPTVIIHSGHGLQAFWALKEPFIFSGDKDKEKAILLSYATWRMLDRIARGWGWKLDPTHNIDRLMRVCGTTNVKDPYNHKPVWCYQYNDVYYTEDEFYEWLEEIPEQEKEEVLGKKGQREENSASKHGLELRRDAAIPQEWWDDMVEIEPDFKELFYKKKDVEKNKNGQDTSLSGYDFSLANYMVMYNWPSQMIADAIIHFRRFNGDEGDVSKAVNRPDYISDIIDRVQKDHQNNTADVNFDQLKQRVSWYQVQGEEPTEDEADRLRQETQAKLATKMQLRIDKILKYQSDPPSYELILQGGKRVPVGESGNLVYQSNLQKKVFEAINYWFARNKSQDWHQIVSTFGAIMEEVPTGQETREEDSLQLWVREYLREAGVWIEADEAYADKRPFIYDGRLYLFLNQLKRNIGTSTGEKIYTKWLSLTLKKLGCHDDKMHFTNLKGSRTSTTVYDITPVAYDFVPNEYKN